MAWKVCFGAGLLVLGLVALFASPPVGAGEEAADPPSDWSARAIQAWSETCQKCHAVPDTGYETDRAFLGQILETT